jgi:hypothetical protein
VVFINPRVLILLQGEDDFVQMLFAKLGKTTPAVRIA